MLQWMISVILILGFLLGWVLLKYSEELIQLQIRFYLHIGWNASPKSMQNEIRNTRILGIILFATCTLATACFFFTPAFVRGLTR